MAWMPNTELNLDSNIDFARKLIKGRIAEVIFEEMFKLSGKFTILPLGYEHTTPILAQYQHHVHVQKVLENLRNAPDFALISEDKTNVMLVEVKYRREINQEKVLLMAKKMLERWDPSFLFMATQEGFYFDSCNSIVRDERKITKLPIHLVPTEIQDKYLLLIRNFIAI
jgi:hypothetical protein